MSSDYPAVAIVIPVLNEAESIQSCLSLLRSRFPQAQCCVVDGGSEDDTCKLVEQADVKLAHSPAGRARQMNMGAQAMDADVYWFIHADTVPPADAIARIQRCIQSGRVWGRFDVRLTGQHRLFRLIERAMNARSCITGIATGDQGIFVRADIFNLIGGYVDMPLMEDVVLSQKLKQLSRPVCIKSRILVSSRRWERYGIWRTTRLMWLLRLRFFMGASTSKLYQSYYGK